MIGSIIPLRFAHQRNAVPPILFIEMFQERLDAYTSLTPRADTVISNCRTLMDRARSLGFPIAFVISKGRSFSQSAPPSRWINGFRPQRNDMVFEPSAASCYSSTEFAEAISDVGGQFVLAGFLGESVCLATVIDAATFGHRAGLIEDALSSRPIFGEAVDSHHVVVGTASRFAAILKTANWITEAGSFPITLEVPRAFQ
jgi:isochorismate hydrolase